jgi:hypothetical protein
LIAAEVAKLEQKMAAAEQARQEQALKQQREAAFNVVADDLSRQYPQLLDKAQGNKAFVTMKDMAAERGVPDLWMDLPDMFLEAACRQVFGAPAAANQAAVTAAMQQQQQSASAAKAQAEAAKAAVAPALNVATVPPTKTTAEEEISKFKKSICDAGNGRIFG